MERKYRTDGLNIYAHIFIFVLYKANIEVFEANINGDFVKLSMYNASHLSGNKFLCILKYNFFENIDFVDVKNSCYIIYCCILRLIWIQLQIFDILMNTYRDRQLTK